MSLSEEELKALQEQNKRLVEENQKLAENVKDYQAKLESQNDDGSSQFQKQLEEQNKRTEAIERENKQLRELRWRDEAFQKYPHAKEFSDLVTGEKSEDVLNKAKMFHEKVETQRKLALDEQQQQLGDAFRTMPHLSPPGLVKQEDYDAAMAEARKKGDINGMMKLKMRKVVMNTQKAIGMR